LRAADDGDLAPLVAFARTEDWLSGPPRKPPDSAFSAELPRRSPGDAA
jgi:hypothetical protein